MLRNRILILLLIAGTGLALYRNYTFFRDRRAGRNPVQAGVAAAAPEPLETYESTTPAGPAPGLRRTDRVAFAAGMGRDPFGVTPERDGVTASGPVDLRLDAVLVSPQRRLALVGGRIYREGDMLAGRRIQRIETDRVVLAGKDRERVLTMETDPTPPAEEEETLP